MTDRLPSTSLAKQSAERELSAFVQAGLLTGAEQRQLSTAVTSAMVMSTVVKPDEKRHLGRINTILAVRQDTPISRARETLVELGDHYESVRGDFHKYRRMVAEARLLRAKATKLRESDDPVMLAEADLMDIQAEEMEANIAEGARRFQAAIEKINTLSTHYAKVCTSAGKESFSEQDFRDEELKYLLQSVVYHASQTSQVADMRDRYDRSDADKLRDQNAKRYGDRAADFHHRNDQMKYAKIVIPAEARQCLQEMGVTEREIQADLQELNRMREGHGMLGPNVDSWEPKYDGWLSRTTDKYLERVRESIAKNGSLRLERIQKLLNPEARDNNNNTRKAWGAIEQSSFTDD